jgi:hypothetical protein
MIACPVCRAEIPDLARLADHFWDLAEASDVGHVMWLNRHVGMREVPREVLRAKLAEALRS